jgi:4'-phosphopantetheinyl transferase EntD
MMESLLPPAVACAEAFDDDPGPVSFAAEAFDDDPGPVSFAEEHVADRATPGRRAEFRTGRRCAREALARLGRPPVAIPTGPHREPLWPAGVVGSITHCTGYRAAAAALATDLRSVGIDAENHAPLPDGTHRLIVIEPEQPMLGDLAARFPATHWDRLLFSAKESVYKAWFPLTGRWLGFEDAHLTIDPVAATFTASLLVEDAPLRFLAGRYLVRDEWVLTAVTV